ARGGLGGGVAGRARAEVAESVGAYGAGAGVAGGVAALGSAGAGVDIGGARVVAAREGGRVVPDEAEAVSAGEDRGLTAREARAGVADVAGAVAACGAGGVVPRRAGGVVAVAGGAAFSFRYAEQAELLAAAGAEVVAFDPLTDEALPPGTRGLVLGGGFPEVYAAELAANTALRREVAAFRGPVAAECGGLLYLGRTLDGHPMCGRLPVEGTMTGRLTLGYREAVALTAGPLAAAGTRLRGHEFHRTAVTPAAGAAPAWGFVRPERRTEGFVDGDVHASYLHLHWAAEPSLATRFVERCAEWTCG
ncbi:MAG: cobyrinic acid a,c-diamide synthase, partial [Streptomyces sp.]|nr:cobyrinic acid a,c-diamide synthase [Streptomyces sp.]